MHHPTRSGSEHSTHLELDSQMKFSRTNFSYSAISQWEIPSEFTARIRKARFDVGRETVKLPWTRVVRLTTVSVARSRHSRGERTKNTQQCSLNNYTVTQITIVRISTPGALKSTTAGPQFLSKISSNSFRFKFPNQLGSVATPIKNLRLRSTAR